jgi:hypothetical protein
MKHDHLSSPLMKLLSWLEPDGAPNRLVRKV